jgi:hypothetical protein
MPAAAPFADPFIDVSDALPTHWQIVDAASRLLKKAIETGAFYQTPDALAYLKNNTKDLDRMVTSYSSSKNLDISGGSTGDDAKIVEPDSAEDEDDE